jgi:3-oxo-5-alpha-steroid 4-dehydrogenase 1
MDTKIHAILLGLQNHVVDESTRTTALAMIMIGTALMTLPILLFGPTAPYGRYSTTGWGFMIPNKLAWVTQEILSLAVPLIWMIFFADDTQLSRIYEVPVNSILVGMFLIHYVNRDVIYPFRLRGGKPTPCTVWFLAFVFCLYNGYMQTYYFLNDAPRDDSMTRPTFILGSFMWLIGWLINLDSDNILISLRRARSKKDTGYKIPKGGMFTYVSAANYFGEIVEWIGYAMASGWALPCVAFAVFTFCNLFPRGYRHHQWYLHRFSTYSRLKRKSVVPFII